MTEQELRELDAWIANRIMGYTITATETPSKGVPVDVLVMREGGKSLGINCNDNRNYARCRMDNIPRYTTDPAAAMAVLKKCLKKLKDSRRAFEFMQWANDKITAMSGNDCQATAETVEQAIAKFAKALFTK